LSKNEFKLSVSPSNIKQLNGWKPDNAIIYNGLTWKQKEAINILIIEQFRYFKPSERLGFMDLVGYVKKNESVIELSDALIDTMQIKKLNKAINEYRKNHENNNNTKILGRS